MPATRGRTPLTARLLPPALYIIAVLEIAYSTLGFIPGLRKFLDLLFTWAIPVPLIDWFAVVVALLLAAGLERRKHSAWLTTMLVIVSIIALDALILLAIFIVGESETAADLGAPLVVICSLVVNIAVLVTVLTGLIAARHYYCVRSRPGNLRRALTVFLLGGLGTTLVGLAILVALNGAINAERIHLLLTGIGWPDWLPGFIGFGWAVSCLVGLRILMRTQREASRTSTEEELRIRTLLAEHPTDSLGYFATRRDKSVLLTEHGGVAYRSAMGVALASGDPLGDPSTWPSAARAFLERASDYGMMPAVIGASEAGARAYLDAGLRALHIGDEAILRTSSFRLAELPEVDRAVRRMTGLGYTVRIRRHSAIGAAEMAELAALADAWRVGEDERGFSMALGRLADPSDGRCIMVEALFPPDDDRGEVAALLSFAPWGADGLSLDIMRRHPQAGNGITEFMVGSLMSSGTDLGVTKVSLNFAVFRSAFAEGARIGAGAFQRLWRRILLFASRWWQLESLYRSNQKYEPEWFPRLICYSDAADLPQVAAAMGVAEGFLHVPRWIEGQVDPQYQRSTEDSAQLLAVSASAARTCRPTRAVRTPAELTERADARRRMLDDGIQPYPASVSVTSSCRGARGQAEVAGRIMSVRDHGGVVFADLRDWSGDLQILLETGRAGAVTGFRRRVRTGDQVAVTGTVGASRTGTRSLLVDSWTMTSKALRPLPDKRRGIKDPEARVRLRYLSLITCSRQRRMIEARSRAIQAVRQTLLGRDYLEVETPMLQPVHGGANARPFRTHINAYDLDLYLRIAPELYLKRLMVGGMDRIFEIGRSFRNEGADATHNPEFTMLEAYQSYADYTVMKEVVRELALAAARAALGTTVVRGTVGGVEHEIDLEAPWRTVSVCEAVSEHLGEPVDTSTPVEALRAHAEAIGMPYSPSWRWGTLVQELYEHLAEGTTAAPTFFTDFPARTSPLTRPHRKDPRLAERWDLIIFGSEVGTAYSELVDPVIQRQRLTAQSLAAVGGDPEAMELDEDFLRALEHGMPPTGGLGVGLDRLVMMLTGASIRETIAFPLVRPDR